ncbi:Scr1 family TA system antitoxin-like transcriptional regulator [Streptomyces sp. NBC_01530]|uniref:Scr1 family TA system antitoxin-like transcriptional regulator n=1 Tax=Streptomyces sp. NBC_01530 TaxID=2903895 RepID=UPI00386B8E76
MASSVRIRAIVSATSSGTAQAAYLEGQGNSHLVSDPNEVGMLARRYAMIRTQALNSEESARLIKQLAGEL